MTTVTGWCHACNRDIDAPSDHAPRCPASSRGPEHPEIAPAPSLEPPAVMGAHEVRVRLQISRPTFAVYRSRPDFPPATELGSGPVFERRAIEAYARQRETARPFLDALRAYRAHIRADGITKTHALALTARDVATTPATVHRCLVQLGEIER